MIFLKKFHAYGFKSFADELNLEFNHPMTGIVGPNGSGKSNIVDALKWVLGEQSIKSLRGSDKTNLIFMGSKGRQESKFAEITLTFDNSNKVLHYDGDEISVTRKLHRNTGINEYYINGQPSRLRDIQEAFLDTGLSKGSLGIISQGTVNWFAESKPQDRRKMFEEAAGIGRYSKKKDESLRHLTRSEEHLNRILDIVNELEKDLKKLNKQAEKAKIFKEKRKQLQDIEITILVRDISHLKMQVTQLKEKLDEATSQRSQFEPVVKEVKQKLEFAKQKEESADQDATNYNRDMHDINEKINTAEKKQMLIHSRLNDDLSSDNEATKAAAYEQLIISFKVDIKELEERLEELDVQIETYDEIVQQLDVKRNNFNGEVNSLSIALAENRMNLKFIEREMDRQNNRNAGVRAILDNRAALNGIYDTVINYLKVDKKFEMAIETALGRSSNNIIVEDSIAARNAIMFLKKNRAGKATFLPLRDIKERNVRAEHLDVLNELEGFIGVASSLVTIEPKLKPITEALLGNTIISDDIDKGIRLSKYTYQMYKVISLEGDIIMPGGAMTGGSNNKSGISTLNIEEKRNEMEAVVREQGEKLTTLKVEQEKVTAEYNETFAKLNQKKFSQESYNNQLENNNKTVTKHITEYEALTKQSFDDKSVKLDSKSLAEELNLLTGRRDKIMENLNVAQQSKTSYRSQVVDYEGRLEDMRMQLDKLREAVFSSEQNITKCNNGIEISKQRINETYKMTVDFAVENYNNDLPMSEPQAREIIRTLKVEIDALGNINLDAVQELEEKQARHDEMAKEKEQLEKAVSDIRAAINELDKKAKEDFARVIDSVNEMIPTTFKFLFGGGTCAISYSDPENILESGIEVMAHPPGKRVSNLTLLSGGEKTLVALSVLFAILKISSFPLVILDEAEAALDIANVERFANIIKTNTSDTQFLIITHRPGTMKECGELFGTTMQVRGVTKMFTVSLEQAEDLTNEEEMGSEG